MRKKHTMEEYIALQRVLKPELGLFFQNFDRDIRLMYYRLRETFNHDRAKIEMALIIANAWDKGFSKEIVLSYLGKALNQYAEMTSKEIAAISLLLTNMDIKMDTHSQDYNNSK
ncbi:uncharacterized protein EV154DRAFT_547290 [Mucor mucedo]|uniref:uncharacterized protein n=1 Tax=Mucor mucedo TaxID=29922 RepID=UPI00221F522F|nr:uncharacterized protein EV154DRAFT_547290 [Mucor mucedo]KAI7896641.1 hypothetical protein EV154DRAFT_547290 [Mucor mucedo]